MADATDEEHPWATRWLRSVRLERFKAAFQPGRIRMYPLTVVIGRNGSGKSTLLEALQWIDTAMRYDCKVACERYHGIHDLVNLRSQAKPLFFRLETEWSPSRDASDDESGWHYGIRVEEAARVSDPVLTQEYLYSGSPNIAGKEYWIATYRRERRVFSRPAVNAKGLADLTFDDPDRLALARGWIRRGSSRRDNPLAAFADFWQRAVFLRLSPNRLAEGSSVSRRSFDPLLDEEGHNLPALLNELSDEQREQLVVAVSGVMKDIVSVDVRTTGPRDQRAFYSLSEHMPYRGRAGRSKFPIPAWMLSEGTRRITAIFALLEHSPPPSLLCIEEIENGLDPWTVIYVLRRLQSAVDSGIQVVVTTHSPWLLDYVPLRSILHVQRTVGETVYQPFADEAEVRAFAASVPPGTRYVKSGGM